MHAVLDVQYFALCSCLHRCCGIASTRFCPLQFRVRCTSSKHFVALFGDQLDTWSFKLQRTNQPAYLNGSPLRILSNAFLCRTDDLAFTMHCISSTCFRWSSVMMLSKFRHSIVVTEGLLHHRPQDCPRPYGILGYHREARVRGFLLDEIRVSWSSPQPVWYLLETSAWPECTSDGFDGPFLLRTDTICLPQYVGVCLCVIGIHFRHTFVTFLRGRKVLPLVCWLPVSDSVLGLAIEPSGSRGCIMTACEFSVRKQRDFLELSKTHGALSKFVMRYAALLLCFFFS